MMDSTFLTTLRNQTSQPIHEAGARHAFVPDGFQSQDMEKYLPAPATKRGAYTFSDSDSLIAYVQRHKLDGRTTVYADINLDSFKAVFVAVINDHDGSRDGQAWGDHRATLTPMQTAEWRRWIAHDRKQMSQLEFANFLEDNLRDINNNENPNLPTGAQMLAMAVDFRHNADHQFKKVLNLQGGGVRMEYVEDADTDTRKQMEVFREFSLGIAPFLNGLPYQVYARLKYKVQAGNLSFNYELVAVDRVFHDAIKGEVAKITEKLEGIPVLFGVPANLK